MEFTPELWQEILFLADWLWENGQKAEGLRDIDLFQDLSLNQIRILRMVQIMTIPLFDNAVRPEGVSLKELAARLNVTAAAASEMVDSLVNRGLLVREPNPNDRRAIRIHFSQTMLKRWTRVQETLARLSREVCADLPEEELHLLMRTLAKINGKLRA